MGLFILEVHYEAPYEYLVIRAKNADIEFLSIPTGDTGFSFILKIGFEAPYEYPVNRAKNSHIEFNE